LDGHLVVLKLGDKFIDFGNEESIFSISILSANKEGFFPQFDDCCEGFQDVCLTDGESRDLLNILEMLVNASLE
jgi:hypothetical protein